MYTLPSLVTPSSSWAQVSLGRIQAFFELEELHPADREWTSSGGNDKGAGFLCLSGTFVWSPADDATDSAVDANANTDPEDAVPDDKERGACGGTGGCGGSGGSGDNIGLVKAKASAVGPAMDKAKKPLTGERRPNPPIQT